MSSTPVDRRLRFGFFRRSWVHILGVGLILFLAVVQTARITDNPNYYPSIIFLGAFLVPVTFVSWAYGRARPEEIPLVSLATCFIWGGVAGTVVAGALEYETLRDLGPFALLGVGLIEESAKLIAPLALYVRQRRMLEADGLVLGVAAGMGFAAFETMGYGFVALIQSNGSIGVLETTLFVRGLLAPAGHGAWTGLICAVLWRERTRRGRSWPNASVAGAFCLAVVLHAAWDAANSFTGDTLAEGLAVQLALSLPIAVASIWLLVRRFHDVDRERVGRLRPEEGKA